MQTSDAITVPALTIQAERQRIGMPISLIDAVNLAANPPAPVDASDPTAMAVAAQTLMVERQRIGMPISYVDAVTEVYAQASAAPTHPIAMSAAAIAMPLPDRNEQAEVAVAMAVEAGKVPEDCRAWAMSYATADLAGFKAFAAGTPEITRNPHAGKRPDQIAGDILKAATDYQASQAKQGLTIDIIQAVSAVEKQF